MHVTRQSILIYLFALTMAGNVVPRATNTDHGHHKQTCGPVVKPCNDPCPTDECFSPKADDHNKLTTSAIAWHPSGVFIATAHRKEGVHIYHVDLHHKKANLITSIMKDHDDTTSLAWSPCGRYLVTGNCGTPNKIYPFFQKGCAIGDPILIDHNDHSSTVALAWCAKFLAVGNNGQPNKVYEFTGDPSCLFKPGISISNENGRTKSIVWNDDCTKIAVSFCEGIGKIYCFNNGYENSFSLIATFGCTDDCSLSLDWSSHCNLLASGNKTCKNKIFKADIPCDNPETPHKLAPITLLDRKNGATTVVDWNKNGRFLFEGNCGAPSKLYKFSGKCCDTSKDTTTCIFKHLDKITAAAWSPCGCWLAVANNGKCLLFEITVNDKGCCDLRHKIKLPKYTCKPGVPGVINRMFDCFCALLANPCLSSTQLNNALNLLTALEGRLEKQ